MLMQSEVSRTHRTARGPLGLGLPAATAHSIPVVPSAATFERIAPESVNQDAEPGLATKGFSLFRAEDLGLVPSRLHSVVDQYLEVCKDLEEELPTDFAARWPKGLPFKAKNLYDLVTIALENAVVTLMTGMELREDKSGLSMLYLQHGKVVQLVGHIKPLIGGYRQEVNRLISSLPAAVAHLSQRIENTWLRPGLCPARNGLRGYLSVCALHVFQPALCDFGGKAAEHPSFQLRLFPGNYANFMHSDSDGLGMHAWLDWDRRQGEKLNQPHPKEWSSAIMFNTWQTIGKSASKLPLDTVLTLTVSDGVHCRADYRHA
jgi:hypothetical protein